MLPRHVALCCRLHFDLHAEFLARLGAQVAEGDELLRTIESVHAAGLDETLWPTALGSITRLIGAAGTTFEVADRKSLALRDLWSYGIPPASEIAYAEHFMSVNPRFTLGLRQASGAIGYDSMFIDEKAMRRDPYYSEFLAGIGLRYFVSSTIHRAPEEFACIAVQRSARQGHVGKAEIALMQRLTPHLRQAFDTTMRLRGAHRARGDLGEALDWLTDGVLLLRADGDIAYCNHAMEALARRRDGVRIAKNRLEFASQLAAGRLSAALATVTKLRDGDMSSGDLSDFPVARTKNKPSYLISVRPLARGAGGGSPAGTVAIVFVHDPLSGNVTAGSLQREMFGFTEAEADVAQALQAGVPLSRYARERAVSLNTVYTHLRRIKDKTGCHRLPELIRKLNDVHLTVRDR